MISNGKSTYELRKRLGNGSMGTVYKAWDFRFESFVAIKVTGTYTADEGRRFRREADLLSELKNPHIVAGYDRIEKHDLGFIVTEFVEGSALDEVLKQTSYSPANVAEWFSQIFDAVCAAHAQHTTHRDLNQETS